MISKTFSAANEVSDPIFLGVRQIMPISITGTFSATVAIERAIMETRPGNPPADDSTAWAEVTSFTAPVEQKVAAGEGCWYRAKCTAYTSGSPAVILDRRG